MIDIKEMESAPICCTTELPTLAIESKDLGSHQPYCQITFDEAFMLLKVESNWGLQLLLLLFLDPENTHLWRKYHCPAGFQFYKYDSTSSLHFYNHIVSFLVKSNVVKLETSCKVIPPPMVSVLY